MLLVDGEVGWLGRAVGQLGEDGGRVGDPDNHALATSNSEQTISRQKNGLTCPPKKCGCEKLEQCKSVLINIYSSCLS